MLNKRSPIEHTNGNATNAGENGMTSVLNFLMAVIVSGSVALIMLHPEWHASFYGQDQSILMGGLWLAHGLASVNIAFGMLRFAKWMDKSL